MRLVATHPSQQNEAAIDPWTLVHTSTGLACGLVHMNFWAALSAAVAYEVIEQYVERTGAGNRFFRISRPESGVNVVVDLAVFSLGYFWGRKWNP